MEEEQDSVGFITVGEYHQINPEIVKTEDDEERVEQELESEEEIDFPLASEMTQEIVQVPDDSLVFTESVEEFCCACTLSTSSGVKEFPIPNEESQTTTVIEALSLIFEYPALATKGKGQIFHGEEHYTLCKTCATVFMQLYNMYQNFTKLLESKGRILEKINEKLNQIDSQFTNQSLDSGTVEVLNERDRYTSPHDTRLMISQQNVTTSKKFVQIHVVQNSETQQESQDEDSSPRKKRGRPTKSGRLKVSSIKIEQQNDSRNELSRVSQKQKNKTKVTIVNDDEDDYDLVDAYIPEVQVSYDDEWPEASTQKTRGKSGRNRKSLEARNSKRSKPSSSTITGKKKKKKGVQTRETITTDPDGTIVVQVQPTTKRVRNWKKESWIEKAKQDPTRTCDLCGKSFIFPAVMLRHKKIVHQGLKPYECSSCGKKFTQKVILNKHTCDFSKETGNRDFLQMTREEELRKFVCKVCNKRFKYPTHLTLHEMNHRDERPFPCDQCDKTFRRPDHLKYHVRIVHVEEKKFICTKCGQTFKSISSLRAHEKKHTSDQGHLCNICGKSIKSMYQMSRHQKTHQDELPFECPVCHKRFKMKDYLGQHLRRGKSCSKKLPAKGCSSSFDSMSIPTEMSMNENGANDKTEASSHHQLHNNSNYNSGKDGDNPSGEYPRVQLPVSEMISVSTIPMEFACFPSPAVDERLLTEL